MTVSVSFDSALWLVSDDRPAYFSSLSFSPEEEHLVWTAEAKMDPSLDENGKSVDPTSHFSSCRYKPDFGERLTGKKRPTLFILAWKTIPPTPSSSAPKAITALYQLRAVPEVHGRQVVGFGQAIFGNTKNRLFATVYCTTVSGENLGIVGCYNRLTTIIEIDVSSLPDLTARESAADEEGSIEVPINPLSSDSARSPRYIESVVPEVIWLSNPVGGPHAGCSELWAYSLKLQTKRRVVGIVDHPVALPSSHCMSCSTNHKFPGIYTDQLPFNPLLLADVIAVNTIWGSRRAIIFVDLKSTDPLPIAHIILDEPDGAGASTIFLASNGRGLMIETSSGMTKPGLLAIRKLERRDGELRVLSSGVAQDSLSRDRDVVIGESYCWQV
jgi:acylaminoacyl-peptidase